jgi:hypothetical protein
VGVRGRALVLAVAVLLAIALASGAVVLAKSINGGPSYDVINGTSGNDVIRAQGSRHDRLRRRQRHGLRRPR